MEDPIASRDAARRVPLSRKSSVVLNSDSETTIPSAENSIPSRKKAGIFIVKLRAGELTVDPLETEPSAFRLPPINSSHDAVSPGPEITKRQRPLQGPPVNRASALRAYAVRQRMDYGSSYAEDAYLPKRFRRSRANNYSRLSNSLDSSGTTQFSGRSSPDRWSRGSRTTSRFSAVHPLSIQHDEIFHTGPTKWTDQPIQSKVGSLDNFDHVAGGGDKDIHEIKYRFNAPNSISSRTKVIYGLRRDKMSADEQENDPESDNGEFEQLPNWRFRPKQIRSKCGTLDNVNHRPAGGTNRIFTERMPWQEGFKYGR